VSADVVERVDLHDPGAPAANEVLVAVECASINQSEGLKIMGRYPVLPASFGERRPRAVEEELKP
jgi:NADPH:quinone reductase-like Zn-dependent oxidoreductase